MRYLFVIALSALAMAVFPGAIPAADQNEAAPQFTAVHELKLPPDYREWVFLSSGLGMTYGPLAATSAADTPRFDNVFAAPAAYRAFRETGQWPDKTVLILEVRDSQSKGSINKGGHFQSDVIGIESEVKENGVWTFYAFGKAGPAGKALPRSENCYTCHAQNGASDNTFVQFYPTLLPVAKAKGTYSEPKAGN